MTFPPQGSGAALDTRVSTIVVAASNSLDPALAPAAYRCSGSADEVEINAALTAAAAVGGEVLLLDGMYVPAVPITYPGNSLGLRGLGRATLIRPAAAAGNAINVTGRDDVIIRDLAIDTKTNASGGHCIFIEDGADRFRVENVWIIDSDADGIHVEGTTIDTGHIVGCHILGADGAGIQVAMDAANYMYRLHIEGNDIGNCGAEGILFTATTGGNHYCEIVNNDIYNPTTDSIKVYDGDYVLIQGNICLGPGDDGIDVRNSDNADITGNTLTGHAWNGIVLGFGGAASTGCTITGNTCQGNGGRGIVLVEPSDDCTITGNTCNGNGQDGIVLQGADGCTVDGNICNGNTQHGIYLVTATEDNTIIGNTCHENDSGDTGTYDGINLSNAFRTIIIGNNCQDNDRYGIYLQTNADYNKVSNNYTNGNTSGSIRVGNANCNNNTIEFNIVEEGAPTDVGTQTRAYGNYDPSANAFVGDVGVAPF